MHPPDLHQKFIEMRAAGVSFAKISSSLIVADSTLRLWDHQHAVDIARLRRLNWEDAEDRVGLTLETRMRRMAEWMKTAEDELEKRHFDFMNNRDLFRFLRMAREEFFRCRRILFSAEHVHQKTDRANKIANETIRRLASDRPSTPLKGAQPSSAAASAAESPNQITPTTEDPLSPLPLGEGKGVRVPSTFIRHPKSAHPPIPHRPNPSLPTTYKNQNRNPPTFPRDRDRPRSQHHPPIPNLQANLTRRRPANHRL
jgi:hypothetical protein